MALPVTFPDNNPDYLKIGANILAQRNYSLQNKINELNTLLSSSDISRDTIDKIFLNIIMNDRLEFSLIKFITNKFNIDVKQKINNQPLLNYWLYNYKFLFYSSFSTDDEIDILIKNFCQILTLFLNKGAEIDGEYGKESPLMILMLRFDRSDKFHKRMNKFLLKMITTLIDNKANLYKQYIGNDLIVFENDNYIYPTDSAFSVAIHQGFTDAIILLLYKGLDINHKSIKNYIEIHGHDLAKNN